MLLMHAISLIHRSILAMKVSEAATKTGRLLPRNSCSQASIDHSGTPSDTYNYNLLLRDLRSKLDELGKSTGNFYGLTAALPCGSSNIANIDIQTVAKYLTEFNLMTYGEIPLFF